MINLHKEICTGCNENILAGHTYLECTKCLSIIHKKCFNRSNIKLINSSYVCINCCRSITNAYNPFREFTESHINKDLDDKFYEDDFLETFDTIRKASNILDNCHFHKLSLAHKHYESKTDFSTLFYNIDGNFTNFDTFAAELTVQKTNYSVIALAETNVGKDKGDLFRLEKYNHFYNDKMPNKSKGTGVCLYIHSSLNATVIEKLCTVTPNLESLFVSINVGTIKINVGVLYRSPNGDPALFLDELLHLNSLLPKKSMSLLLGDFNFDLLKRNNTETQDFENTFLSLGYFPLISRPTHSINNQQSSCIDNILTNSIDTVTMTGVIEDFNSHHRPIFSRFNVPIGSNTCLLYTSPSPRD